MEEHKKKLSHRNKEEIKQIYEMIHDEIDKMLGVIQEKTGYYTTGKFLLFEDEPKKCMDVDLKIALLENPHRVNIDKMEYYVKVNPDNCLNEPIRAYNHNSWYMIYDGVHRTAANSKLNKKTIKADIIVPNPKHVE